MYLILCEASDLNGVLMKFTVEISIVHNNYNSNSNNIFISTLNIWFSVALELVCKLIRVAFTTCYFAASVMWHSLKLPFSDGKLINVSLYLLIWDFFGILRQLQI